MSEEKAEFLCIAMDTLSAKGLCMDCNEMVEGKINLRFCVGPGDDGPQVGLEIGIGDPGPDNECHPVGRVPLSRLPGVNVESVVMEKGKHNWMQKGN